VYIINYPSVSILKPDAKYAVIKKKKLNKIKLKQCIRFHFKQKNRDTCPI